MATTNHCKKSGKVLLSILSIIMSVSLVFSLLSFTACGETPSVSDPSYSYSESSENGDSLIVNPSFAKSIDDNTAFPVTSTSDWSKGVDGSASSSSVDSGVISVADEKFKTLASSLYSDVDFSDYIKNKFGKSKTDIESEIKAGKAEGYTVTNSDYADYIIEKSFVKNPKTHSDDADNFVYMLNNYTSDSEYALGTAQKITSTSINMEAGKIYKVSVWVKTENLSAHGDFGANIRLSNTFNGTKQADYRISNIKDTDWTNYILFVKADEHYTCNFSLVLGLGYGDGTTAEFVEGTAYFDDITVETVDVIPPTLEASKMDYTSDSPIEAVLSDKCCAYDMTFNAPTSYLADLDLSSASIDLTESNITAGGKITSKTIVGNETPFTEIKTADKITLTLDSAAVTVSLDYSEFTVSPEGYAYVSFDLDNNLNAFNSTAIAIDVIDKFEATTEKRAAVTTYSDITTETAKCGIMIKNNFSEKGNKDRSFVLNIVIGPASLGSVNYSYELASGTVTISNLQVATGKSYQYERTDYLDGSSAPIDVSVNGYENVSEYTETENETVNYKYYNFFNSVADANVALYAGFAADYYEVEDEHTVYSITTAPSEIGKITSLPTNPKSFFGVEANHVYLNDKEGSIENVNTRAGNGDENGNIAGLINTQYLSAYLTNASLDIASKLGDYDDEIQPIMIYNADGTSYGFLSEEKTISSSTNATVSVTLRVADSTAKAYVYIVDTAHTVKNIMTFDTFSVGDKVYKGEDRKLCFEITNDMMDSDGWVTVKFFIAAGATSKKFRLEVWNGDRNGKTDTVESKGFVFIKDMDIELNSSFTESETTASTFNATGSPLYEYGKTAFIGEGKELLSYTRPLSDLEKQYNKEYPNEPVLYKEKYIWAKNDSVIYAVYNTVDPVENDPYANVEEETEEESGCATTDSSTFWFSFSSILLAVVLILAIIALFIKTIRRKRKANASDAKSHYTVKSRISTSSELKKQKTANKPAIEEKVEEPEETEVPAEEIAEEPTEEKEDAENQTLDSYVYGDVVSDFGDAETNEQKPEEENNESGDNGNA